MTTEQEIAERVADRLLGGILVNMKPAPVFIGTMLHITTDVYDDVGWQFEVVRNGTVIGARLNRANMTGELIYQDD